MNTIEDIIRTFNACRTQQEFYHIFKSLQIAATPTIFAGLHARLDELPPEAKRWAERQCSRIQGDIQSYGSEPLNAAIVQFTNRDAPARSVVVGFTGSAHLLMTSSPVFLQSLPRGRCDLLLIRDLSDQSFMYGFIPGKGFIDSLEELKPLLSRYEEVICLGTSSGGVGGQMAGRYLGAGRTVSIGGFLPHKSLRSIHQTIDMQDLYVENLKAVSVSPRRRTLTVYSVHLPQDAQGAHDIARDFGAESIGVDTNSHLIIDVISRAGRLAWFSESMLFGDPPPLISMGSLRPLDVANA